MHTSAKGRWLFIIATDAKRSSARWRSVIRADGKSFSGKRRQGLENKCVWNWLGHFCLELSYRSVREFNACAVAGAGIATRPEVA
jgi:hypothetical protein